LAEQLDVDYVSSDRVVRASLDYSAAAIGAEAASSFGRTGRGVGIVVVDSGIDTHADLPGNPAGLPGLGRPRVVYSESSVPGPRGKMDGETGDPFGHGTHLSIAATSLVAGPTRPRLTGTGGPVRFGSL